MRPVLVGVGQDDYLFVFEIGEIEFLSYARVQRGDNGSYFLVGKHLIHPLLFRVERLAAQRQNSLKFSAARLLSRASGAVALYDEQLV